MTFKLFIAALSIAALPLVAQAQQGNRPQQNAPAAPKPTPTDVQRVVGIITADKAKTQAYCDIIKLDEQIGQAEHGGTLSAAEGSRVWLSRR